MQKSIFRSKTAKKAPKKPFFSHKKHKKEAPLTRSRAAASSRSRSGAACAGSRAAQPCTRRPEKHPNSRKSHRFTYKNSEFTYKNSEFKYKTVSLHTGLHIKTVNSSIKNSEFSNKNSRFAFFFKKQSG
jgi:hypothetical protein